MKKTTILAILISAFLALNISAQTTEGGLTKEQKMIPFAVGMSLSVLGETYDDNYHSALTEFQTGISYYSADLKPVVDLEEDASSYVRMDVALKATKAVREKASKSDKWQMLVGERFGTIYVQFKKNKIDGDEINVDDLKFSLEMIGTLAGNAPEDIPADIVKEFKELGKMKDLKNIGSEANIEKITDKVIGILSMLAS